MKTIAILLALAGCGVLRAPGGAPTSAPVLAVLEREPCLGECPVYTLTFYADGTIEYDGQYADVTGRHVFYGGDGATIAAVLRYRFRTAGWAALQVTGDVVCTDMPGGSIDYDGKRIEWNDGQPGVPPQVHRLANDLDRLAGSERWVGLAHVLAAPEGSYCEDTRTIYLAPPAP